MPDERSKQVKDFLSRYIPKADMPDNLEFGWGFGDKETGKTTIRDIPLELLGADGIAVFWEAVRHSVRVLQTAERSEYNEFLIYTISRLNRLKQEGARASGKFIEFTRITPDKEYH